VHEAGQLANDDIEQSAGKGPDRRRPTGFFLISRLVSGTAVSPCTRAKNNSSRLWELFDLRTLQVIRLRNGSKSLTCADTSRCCSGKIRTKYPNLVQSAGSDVYLCRASAHASLKLDGLAWVRSMNVWDLRQTPEFWRRARADVLSQIVFRRAKNWPNQIGRAAGPGKPCAGERLSSKRASPARSAMAPG
jgi:hypothetical protein